MEGRKELESNEENHKNKLIEWNFLGGKGAAPVTIDIKMCSLVLQIS